MVMIEGKGWQDFEELELPAPPGEGEPVETKYGTCFVTKVEQMPQADRYDWKVFCRAY
jgi:hypothetical protein